MSRIDPQQGLQPSLLDRLIDPETKGTSWRRGYGLQDLMDVVRRDLEDLLNTRQTYTKKSGDSEDLEKSILAYGLPDLTLFNANTTQQQEEIGRELEKVVTRFEPRLRDVRATILEPADSNHPTVRFRIDAKLSVEPSPDVSYETVLELTNGHSTVKHSEP